MLRWLSIEAHLQNGALTMSLPGLPLQGANMVIMDNSKQIASQITYL